MTVTPLIESDMPMVRIEIPHTQGMVTVPCTIHNARCERSDRELLGVLSNTLETIRGAVKVEIPINAEVTILDAIHSAQDMAERHRKENGLDPLPIMEK